MAFDAPADEQQIGDVLRTAPSNHAVAMIRVRADRGEAWTWRAVALPPHLLGSYDGESDAFAVLGGPIVSPVIALRDPGERFARGCSTNSHWSEFDAGLDIHSDCEHELAAKLAGP